MPERAPALRIALATNFVPPYRLPVFEALAGTPGWKLRIFTSAEGEFDRRWPPEHGGLDVVRVPSLGLVQRFAGGSPASQLTTLHLPAGLFAALLRFAPDVVVSGELGPRSAFAWAASRVLGVPLVLWAYPSLASAAGAGRARNLLRRALLARSHAVIGMGSQARRALRALGAPDARIFDAPNAHDAAGIARALAGADVPALRRELRERHGCRERVALVAGRLIEVKGIRPLLRAWRGLPEELRSGWTLLFVGDGPLARRVGDAAALAPRGELLRLPAVAPEQMPGLYAASDLLVFPTLADTWGLVVNEALACGLPVLCSRLAGACDELLREGPEGNGFCADPREPGDLAGALRGALCAGDLRERGRRGQESVRAFGPGRMAAGMRAAISSALAGSRAEALRPAAEPAARLHSPAAPDTTS